MRALLKSLSAFFTLAAASSVHATAPSAIADLGCVRHAAAPSDYNLRMRSIAILKASLKLDADSNSELVEAISPTAPVVMGAGDVGPQPGQGFSAVKTLAQQLQNSIYRYKPRDTNPDMGPAMRTVIAFGSGDGDVDICDKQDVEIEFLLPAEDYTHQVTFSYDQGVLVEVHAWGEDQELGTLNG